MQIFRGTSANTGTAFGIIRRLENPVDGGEKGATILASDDEATLKNERFRFLRARVNVDLKLKELEKKTGEELGPDEAKIFEVARMFLRDGSFIGEILDQIAYEKLSAESAVRVIGERYYNDFLSLEDDYMRARSEDINEVTEMLLEALNKPKEKKADVAREEDAEGVIILATTISAADFMSLDFDKVKGIILTKGSPLSHASIMARGKGIPMIVCCNIDESSGRHCIMNADSGMVYVDPTTNILKEFSQRKLNDCMFTTDSNYLIVNKHAKCSYFVNVGNNNDVDKAVRYGVQGIGLYRSEFLYFDRPSAPSEDELFKQFKEALGKMNGKAVVIRTIDFGIDKVPSYLKIPDGMRGLDFSLYQHDLLKTELRALYRASVFGNLYILLPMVHKVREVREAKFLISEVKRELAQEKKDFNRNVKLGIMVETPEAIENIASLSREVKFMSIGTNDLTHFLLGIPREEFAKSKLSSSEKETMLASIKKIADAGKDADVHVSICGELATDPEWAEEFVRLGITSLSISI